MASTHIFWLACRHSVVYAVQARASAAKKKSSNLHIPAGSRSVQELFSEENVQQSFQLIISIAADANKTREVDLVTPTAESARNSIGLRSPEMIEAFKLWDVTSNLNLKTFFIDESFFVLLTKHFSVLDSF